MTSSGHDSGSITKRPTGVKYSAIPHFTSYIGARDAASALARRSINPVAPIAWAICAMCHDRQAWWRYNWEHWEDESAGRRPRLCGECAARRKGTAMAQQAGQLLDVDTLRGQIREHIYREFLFDGETADLDDDISLLQEGIVDATGVLELVLFVEDTYGVRVAEADLTPENFDSVNNLAHYVSRQLANM